MKKYLYTLCLFLLALTTGCNNNDDDSGTITFLREGLFVEGYGAMTQTTFTYSNIATLGVLSAPDGWIVKVYLEDKYLTATSPTSGGDENGYVTLSGTNHAGDDVTAYLYVGMVEKISLLDDQANSMVATKPNTVYTFNPKLRGESSVEMNTNIDYCWIVWRTGYAPIDFLQMTDDGMFEFYTTPDTYDIDDDGEYDDLIEGNALVAAMDSDDNIIWTWHIWVTEEGYSEVKVGDVTFMDRNVGALDNANSSQTEILNSYGLYYQWGRKDPFIYPGTYNAASSSSAYTYDHNGTTVTISFLSLDDDSDYGTVDYTIENPMDYILTEFGTTCDWMYTPNDNLWDDNGAKSIYDPSPKGWRVPSVADFAALRVDDNQSYDQESYGLTIDGELFMALGFRDYVDGSIQNLASGDSYTPWAGYYWSRSVSGTSAYALHFDSNNTSSDNIVSSEYRANALQIRCVKME